MAISTSTSYYCFLFFGILLLNSSVLVFATETEGAIRLVGGGSSRAGRLEVYHSGQWGTVCNHGFGTREAQVACRQLGYTGGSLGAPWLDSGPIWIDNLDCVGHESAIADCSRNVWGDHNCRNIDNVAIACDSVQTTSWSRWSSWGSCSSTCGGGSRSRSDGTNNRQEENCNTQACPHWGSWSSWGSCSCGGGSRSRSRSCIGSGTCGGSKSQREKCNTETCPYWSKWGSWSPCTTTCCGGGTQTRSRSCTGKSSCSSTDEDDRDCNTQSCWFCCDLDCPRSSDSDDETYCCWTDTEGHYCCSAFQHYWEMYGGWIVLCATTFLVAMAGWCVVCCKICRGCRSQSK